MVRELTTIIGHFSDGTPFGNWNAAEKKNNVGGFLRPSARSDPALRLCEDQLLQDSLLTAE